MIMRMKKNGQKKYRKQIEVKEKQREIENE